MPQDGCKTSSANGSSPTASLTPVQLSMFDLPTLPVSSNAISSQASADGPSLCEERGGLTLDLFGQEAAPASPSRCSASGLDTQTHGTFGRLGLGSSASDDLQRSLANSLRQLLAGSDLCEVIWKRWVTPWGRCLSRPHARCAEQLRDRYWFVADCDIQRRERAGARLRPGSSTSEARHDAGGRSILVNSIEPGLEGHARHGGDEREESQAAGSAAEAGLQLGSGAVADSAGKRSWTGLREGLAIIDGDGAASDSREFDLAICRIDGKVRRIKPGLRLVADGIPARVDKLRALGNAIDPRPAAAFIAPPCNASKPHEWSEVDRVGHQWGDLDAKRVSRETVSTE